MEKIYLFNGRNLDNWVNREDGSPAKWKVEDGVMSVVPFTDSIYTKETFGDAHIHVEFNCPDIPGAVGQSRSNSGVYIQGAYEVQVLDSYGVEPYTWNDCGAIYNFHTPLVNACTPPDTWQTYDIYFRTARFDEKGEIVEFARLTLIQNGRVIHNNIELKSNTDGGLYSKVVAEGPLYLQDHGDVVHFRNIWIEKL